MERKGWGVFRFGARASFLLERAHAAKFSLIAAMATASDANRRVAGSLAVLPLVDPGLALEGRTGVARRPIPAAH